jgi:phenylpropionate dioxygenase-like ring-hydroxylating dioxygenase large terminal subunit
VRRISQYWHPVAESQDVGIAPISVELLGMPVVLFRSDGAVVAARDLCVHRGARLSMGTVDGGCLVCPYHGWRYDAQGACVHIPSIAAGSAIPSAARTPTYHVREEHSMVWVALEDPELPVPTIPGIGDGSGYVSRCWARFEWNASAGRVVENAMDLAHFPFVHPYLLADPETPTVLDYHVESTERGVSFTTGRFRYAADGLPQASGWTQYVHDFPFTHHLRIVETSPGGEIITVFSNFNQPVSVDRTRIWWFATKNCDFGPQDDADLEVFMKVLDQDRMITESRRPASSPVDLRAELPLKVPDAPSIAYRRWLQDVDMMGLRSP